MQTFQRNLRMDPKKKFLNVKKHMLIIASSQCDRHIFLAKRKKLGGDAELLYSMLPKCLCRILHKKRGSGKTLGIKIVHLGFYKNAGKSAIVFTDAKLLLVIFTRGRIEIREGLLGVAAQ